MNMDGNTYLRAFCLSGVLNYTRYVFGCVYKSPFFIGNHHRIICDALDRVMSGEVSKLIINIAPRYGKTELAVKSFISMGLAMNPSSKFIHLSYSDDLAHDNSEAIRDIVKSDEYQSIFPYVSIKDGSDSKKKWLTTEGGGVYATSTGGQITGFGAGAVGDSKMFAGAIVIDDPIKPEDALSDAKREKVNQRFETTIRNRVNSRNTPIIIIMQRLHENDLCGYLMRKEPGEWEVISLPVLSTGEGGEENPLWPFKHRLEELHKLRDINPFVFETQYMQNPTPMEGLLYGEFKTYKEIPYTNRHIRKNYTDTADTGADRLCSIDYIDTEIGNFILNVIYTDAPMEETEPMVARMLSKDNVIVANIESNNGGRGFARNVESQLRIFGNTKTEVRWFHQSENKETRIFTRSADVMNLTYMPEGWETMWPEFHAEISGYRKFGKNLHDDACFIAGTKIATVFGLKNIEEIRKGDKVITPFGLSVVLEAMCTGYKPVVARFGLIGTPTHKIFNKYMFRGLQECECELLNQFNLIELIRWRLKIELFLTEENTGLWGRELIISANLKAMREGNMRKAFMSRFGNIIIRKKYLKGIQFITRMVTRLITTLLIWSAYRIGNIFLTIRRCVCKMMWPKRRIKSISKESGTWPQNGIEVKQGGSGIRNMQKENIKGTELLFAKTVGKCFMHHLRRLGSVAMNVARSIGPSNLIMNVHACNVGKHSDTARGSQVKENENSVVCPALQDTGTCIRKVYNIKVDKAGCYYANGILVSNCDSLTGTIEKRGAFDYNSYKGGEVDFAVVPIIEIHPLLNGKYVRVKAYFQGGKIYVDDALIGEPKFDELRSWVGNGDVQMEASKSMLHYVRDYRKNVGPVWAREERSNKLGYMQSFIPIVEKFLFRRCEDMEPFMRNLMDYDGRDVYESMYVLCCISDRIKRMSNG